MEKKDINRRIEVEILRQKFLDQPVVGTIVEELANATTTDAILKKGLIWVGISGSKAKQAEINGLNGVVSDDDMVILLDGSNPNDPLNMEVYERVLDKINEATKRIVEEKATIPIYASTIRLEDAQMAIARIVNSTGLPVRMVHSLIYPSKEAALSFEPPGLARNLFGQSLGLWGNNLAALEVSQMARNGHRVENINLTIGGLDGISDNFRMLRTNRHILPAIFLAPQSVHVLDYSLKWAMASVIEKSTGDECGTWEEIIAKFPSEEDEPHLIGVVREIRKLRFLEAQADLNEIEDLYRRVISLWPTLTTLRTRG